MENSEGYDSYKVYIWMMTILCTLTFIWFLYNYYVLSSYEDSFVVGLTDYKKIVALEKSIPPRTNDDDSEEKRVIENAITFFKRTVKKIVPNNVGNPEKETQSTDEIIYETYTYKIGFKSISRNDLAKYIFYIQQEAKSLGVNLKVKNIDMSKVESVATHVDAWRVDLEFITRYEIE